MLHNSIWRYRDLRVVAPARALSFLGDEIAVVALLLRFHDEGYGELGVAALLLATAVPTILAAPWAGRLVDRSDSRRLLVTAGLVQAAICVALASTGSLVATVALVAALQCVQAAAGPGWQALVPSIVGEDDVPKAFGLLQSLNFLAAVAGPAVAGLLVVTGGSSAALLVDAGTFAVLAVAAAMVRTRRGGALAPGDTQPRALDGLRLVRADRLVWTLVVSLVVFVMAGESTNVVEVFLVRDVLGASALTFGALGAAFAVGAAVGAVLGGRLRDIGRQIDGVLLACGVVSCSMVVAGLVTVLPIWAAVWVMTGVAVGALQTICGSVLGVRAPAEARGQVFATVAAATRAASLVATALGGVVGALLGPQSVFVVAGLGCLVATLGAVPSLRRSARLSRQSGELQAQECRESQVA